MRFSRFQPFRPAGAWNQLQQFQEEMNRLFDRWGQSGTRTLGLAAAFPPVNLWEDENALVLQAELPGLELKDLEIYITGGNQLTIKGSRKQPTPPTGLWHRQERAFGDFVRVIELPYAVDADKVDARLENGVLVIRLTKHESARPRKITVKAE